MCPAFLEALDYWTWKYLRLMWSDDALVGGAVYCMLDVIKTYNSKLILSNRDKIDKRISEKYSIKDEKLLNFNWFSDFWTYLWYKDGQTYYKENYFTFISVFCIDKFHYKKSLHFLLNDLNISENYLKNHYFNFSFIWFCNLYVHDIITVIETPHLIYHGSDNKTSWRLNRKVVYDLYSEMRFLIKTYSICKNWRIIMKKIAFWWWMSLYILPVFRKICKLPILQNIYNYLSKKHIKSMWIE